MNFRHLIVRMLFPLGLFACYVHCVYMQLAVVRFSTHSINGAKLSNYCIFLINKVGIILNISWTQSEMNAHELTWSIYVLVECPLSKCVRVRFHRTLGVFTTAASRVLKEFEIEMEWNRLKWSGIKGGWVKGQMVSE